MKRISRATAKSLAREILLLLALATLISMTGCSRPFVVVDGGATAIIKKANWTVYTRITSSF